MVLGLFERFDVALKAALLAAISAEDNPEALTDEETTVLFFEGMDDDVMTERSCRTSPPSFFAMASASLGSIEPMFRRVRSIVPGSRVFADFLGSSDID